jgi:hypothetical protein
MTGSRAVRRILGGGAALSAISIVILFVVAALRQSDVLGAVDAAGLLILMALLWPWAYLQGNQNEAAKATFNKIVADSKTGSSGSILRLPAASDGAGLIRRHLVAAIALAVAGLGGVVLIAAALILPSVEGELYNVLVLVGLALFGIGVTWGLLFRFLYLRPQDAQIIVANRSNVYVWQLIVATRLRKFIEATVPSVVGTRLHRNAYVLMDESNLEIWRRDGKSLERIFVLSRDAVAALSAGTATDSLQTQPCVDVQIKVDHDKTQSVPLILQRISDGPQGWTPAIEYFINVWNTRQSRL